MSRMNSFVAGLGLAALLSRAALAGDRRVTGGAPLRCRLDDIQATTGVASVLLTALDYEPQTIQLWCR